MAMSGINVHDECVAKFDELKTGKKHRFLIFHIENNAVVKVAAVGARTASFDEFQALLKKDEPAYAVFDFEYDAEDGSKRAKLIFLTWIPDVAKTKPKMIYASTKESLKQKIEGGLVEVQATDVSEITREAILAKIHKK